MRRLPMMWAILTCAACHRASAGRLPGPSGAARLVGRWSIVFEGERRSGAARPRTAGRVVFLPPPDSASPMPSRLRIDFTSVVPLAMECYDRGAQTIEVVAEGDSIRLWFTTMASHCRLEGTGHWHGETLAGKWQFDGEMSRMAVGRFWMQRVSE